MNLPVKWALTEMSLSSINDHETEASISMVFQSKFGLLGALMGVLMMKPMMRKIFSQVLHGPEHHARTGEVIGKGGAPVVKDGLAPA